MWALLLVAFVTGAVLRLWGLGEWPPGLYRDEAFNGLDALDVLDGQHALFFAANNGREPAYVYLTAAAVALFGRSVLAVRLAASLAGTLATLATYLLARSWFGWRAGLFAAWLWAVTLWPRASEPHWPRPSCSPLAGPRLWLAGGSTAVTACAVAGGGLVWSRLLHLSRRPLHTAADSALLSYLFLNRPAERARLRRGVLVGGLAALLILLPLGLLAWRQPELVLGRTGQVSILDEGINQGDFWGTLLRHTGRTLALFLWKGDTIARHNPPGRPLFDLLMAVPFLVGLAWSVRHWRRPTAAALLLWVGVMLGPTLLAEDAPHFLRAVGILPAALLLPALGLSKLWDWPKLPGAFRHGLVLILTGGTLIVTVMDYSGYARDADTAYLFEAGARELAEEVNRSAQTLGVHVYLDRTFWQSWPSLRFLVGNGNIRLFEAPSGLPRQLPLQAAIYVWPYEPLDYIAEAVADAGAGLIFARQGALVRGDLEPEPYPLYYNYLLVESVPDLPTRIARFGSDIDLRDAVVSLPAPNVVQVDLLWQGGRQETPLVAFVHVLQDGRLVGQDDALPLQGTWSPAWWRADLVLHDRHRVVLDSAFNPEEQDIIVGLYDANTVKRLPVYDATGNPAGDSWQLQVHKEN